MTKQNTSSNGVPQGNAAHSTSENANNIINANLYAEIRYVNSKGKQISRIVNLDNRYGHSNLNRAFGALGRLNESSKTTIVSNLLVLMMRPQVFSLRSCYRREDTHEKAHSRYLPHTVTVGLYSCP